MDSIQSRKSLLPLLLVLVTLAVYGQVADYDFLVWDDYEYILDNPHVRTGLSVENALWAFTTTHASYWHPLTWLSHMLDCEIFGLHPRGHHVHALLLHAANTLLLFLLLRNMTGASWRSAFVAAVFSLHPLRIESVAWVAERKDVLATFFCMTTLWAYLGFTRRQGAGNYILTVFSFALGLMTKPTLVTLPFVLLLLDYWPLGRFRLAPHESIASAQRAEGMRSPGLLILEKVPLLLLAAGSSLFTFLAVRGGGGVYSDALPVTLRLENAVVSYVKYMGKMIWPVDLAFLYPHPMGSLPLWQVTGFFLVFACICLVVFFNARQRPYLLVGWLWYLGTLVPVIGLVQVGAQGMADRFTYVPHVGISIAVVWGISDLTEGWPRRNILLAVISGLILSSLALSTHCQLRYWKDGVSLFQRAIQVTSANYVAHYQLGNEYLRQAKAEKAAHHFSEALRIRPGHFLAHHNLGSALLLQGRLDEAILHYREAIRIRPQEGRLYLSLGNALGMEGKWDEAIAALRGALKVDPSNWIAHTNLGYIFLKSGRTREAIRHFSEALRINPEDHRACQNLHLALKRLEN